MTNVNRLVKPTPFYLRVLATLAIIVGLVGVASPPVSAAGLPLEGVLGFTRDTNGLGSFEGTFRLDKLEMTKVGNGFVIAATGLLTGTATNASGTPQQINKIIKVPLIINKPGPTNVCQILDLDLGPIHLDVLGLVIDISEIHVDITAVPGGGLLGDLLCNLSNNLLNIQVLENIELVLAKINKQLAQ